MSTVTTSTDVTYLVLGPSWHGVTRHAADLAGPAGRSLQLPQLPAVVSRTSGVVHVHLTDALLGDDAASVAQNLALLAGWDASVHLTLHDIPQPAEGQARYERRAGLYRQLVALARGVQVCSEHERQLLAQIVGDQVAQRAAVVPLPVDLRPVPRPQGQQRPDTSGEGEPKQTGRPTLGVLGFVHPGKDPMAAVELAGRVGADVEFIGRVGPGHEALGDELRETGARLGVRVHITGHLSDADLDAHAARVDVPLAVYRHISASGSIGRWVALQRRPIVLRSPWTEEFEQRAPGSLHLVTDETLTAAVARAVADPSLTWLSDQTLASPGWLTTAQARVAQADAIVRAERQGKHDTVEVSTTGEEPGHD